MSTLVQFEHITQTVGLHKLGQRIYYADAYWHWTHTAPGLPAQVQVGYAAGWGWFQCSGGASTATVRGKATLGCHRALMEAHEEQEDWQTITHLIKSIDAAAWPKYGAVAPLPTWQAPEEAGGDESAIWKDAYTELGMLRYNKEAMAVNRKMAALAATADTDEGQD